MSSSRYLQDVIYLVDQMIHAERRLDSVRDLVFYYNTTLRVGLKCGSPRVLRHSRATRGAICRNAAASDSLKMSVGCSGRMDWGVRFFAEGFFISFAILNRLESQFDVPPRADKMPLYAGASGGSSATLKSRK